MPFPTTESEMRTFLGLGKYPRDFTIHYSDLVAPLHELTKASTDWTDVASKQYLFAQVSLIKIKEIVSNFPRLNAIDYSLPVVLPKPHIECACPCHHARTFTSLAYAPLIRKPRGTIVPCRAMSRWRMTQICYGTSMVPDPLSDLHPPSDSSCVNFP
jgi:hypothetical protein